MAGLPSAQAPAAAQLDRSRPDLPRFAVLAVQLALLLLVFRRYGLESQKFFILSCLIVGGFAVAYWLPFRFKEPFVIVLSLAGSYLLLDPMVASLLIAAGVILFAMVRSGLDFRLRVLMIIAFGAICACGRATGRLPIPDHFWAVFGAIFMFRMIVYLYDVKHLPGPPRLSDFLSYFFLLPNYYFLLFPVIDFKTFRKSYFQRDIHIVAQQGVWWIIRGTIQLLLYRLVYQLEAIVVPPRVAVSTSVVARIILGFLLYLQVSGQFHIIVGMLHLFGYDLPETNRKYLLSRSISDFWRRINIYWKDFMVKICYLPAYFKLRRSGELRAQLVATVLVFLVTWALHVYQFFWLQGTIRVTVNDTLFWTILGTLVVANVWIEAKQPKRVAKSGSSESGSSAKLWQGLQIVATMSGLMLLWSLWSFNNLTDWVNFLETGNL
jgi:D-alanyl-lipoteichoic acid acyltransferase DltB (MBOAT superfamily)